MAAVDPAHDPDAGPRRLSIAAFIALVFAYLILIQGIGWLAASSLDDFDNAELRTREEVVLGLIVPIGASLLFVYGAVAALGWWRPVLVDRRRVQRWLWVIPILLLVSVAVAIDYGRLADHSVTFVLLLLLATQCVGFAEEGMFRGIGVTAFRLNGFSEGKVALWTSVIFGAAHLSNAIAGKGLGAVAQAAAVSFAGYFFYLTRRVSGGLVLPAVTHGLFDFSILSATALGGDTYIGAVGPILVYPVLAIILLVRRHHIEPAAIDLPLPPA